MKATKWIVLLFAVAALYDGVLGFLFLAAPGWPFEQFNVTPPNHVGYVQFPAALLLIFGLMFVIIARNPAANRGLILYGILLKVAYCSVAGSHWLATDIPVIWKPFVVIDVVMGVLFVWAYVSLANAKPHQPDT
jgi:pheromone shutdown protein TraB